MTATSLKVWGLNRYFSIAMCVCIAFLGAGVYMLDSVIVAMSWRSMMAVVAATSVLLGSVSATVFFLAVSRTGTFCVPSLQGALARTLLIQGFVVSIATMYILVLHPGYYHEPDVGLLIRYGVLALGLFCLDPLIRSYSLALVWVAPFFASTLWLPTLRPLSDTIMEHGWIPALIIIPLLYIRLSHRTLQRNLFQNSSADRWLQTGWNPNRRGIASPACAASNGGIRHLLLGRVTATPEGRGLKFAYAKLYELSLTCRPSSLASGWVGAVGLICLFWFVSSGASPRSHTSGSLTAPSGMVAVIFGLWASRAYPTMLFLPLSRTEKFRGTLIHFAVITGGMLLVALLPLTAIWAAQGLHIARGDYWSNGSAFWEEARLDLVSVVFAAPLVLLAPFLQRWMQIGSFAVLAILVPVVFAGDNFILVRGALVLGLLWGALLYRVQRHYFRSSLILTQ